MKYVTVFVFKASLEVVLIIQCETDLILAILLTIVDKINESLCYESISVCHIIKCECGAVANCS